MGQEYDQFIEKDPAVFNQVFIILNHSQLFQKVHTEVEFALLRISEKRYKAEKEVEYLKSVLQKKNVYIRDCDIKMREYKQENQKLKDRIEELEKGGKRGQKRDGSVEKKVRH